MGLFSTKKTIVVSSTVYNMAGDEANRPNFLKSSVFSAIMSPHQKYLGETIVGNYLTGPGIKQRSLFNYAIRNDVNGLPTYSVSQTVPISAATVSGEIPVPGSPAGLEVVVQDAFIADGDYDIFAKEYVLTNHPTLVDTEYVSEYDADAHTITIQFVGGATETFSAGIYDPNARYVVANYFTKKGNSVQPLVTGTSYTGILPASLPSTTGYTLESTVNTGDVSYPLSQTEVETKSYSDGRPDVVTTTYPSPTVIFNGVDTLRTKEVYEGNDGSNWETQKKKYFYHRSEYRQIYTGSQTTVTSSVIGGGVTETVTTVLSGDFVRPIYDYRIDTQVTILDETYGGAKIFIYKIGTGNTVLDALDAAVGTPVLAEFYPFIPVRLNNKSITHADYMANGLYEESRKLYKKSTSKQKFQELIEQVEANEDLDEIDYAYVQWGVTLNTGEMASRRYLWEFFKNQIIHQNTDSAYMTSYVSMITGYNAAKTAYVNWTAAQSNPASPLYNTAKPSFPYLAAPKTTTIKLKTDSALLGDFDNRISWINITETTHTGVGRVGAKKDDVWFTTGSPISWSVLTGFEKTVDMGYAGTDTSPAKPTYTTNKIELVYLWRQTGANTYSKMTIYGLTHQNFIYGGKCVTVTAKEALEDLDNSGFLVPLHFQTVKEMGIVDATQMATANTYIVFNSYKIFKKKWYQTFLGMLFIFLIVIVIAAIVAPNFVGGMSGALGQNAAVGAGFGFTGTAAIVAGAMSNVLAGMLISMIMTEVTTAVFGEQWGALIGAILSVAISFGGADLSNVGNILSPSNLLKFTDALSNVYSGWVQGNIYGIQEAMQENQVKYDEEMKKIQDLLKELQGNNDLYFNPMSLTDTRKGNGSGTGGSYLPESLDEFIHRTTMTGSDIVDVTLALINDFSKLSLTLPKE